MNSSPSPDSLDDVGPTEAQDESISPPTIGKYACIRVLGRGANGVVWKAYDTQLRRVVALKLLRNSSACRPEARARFKSEARAGARLRHPSIVAVLDADEHEGELFIVQELVGEAKTLLDWIETARQLGGPAEAYFREAVETAAALGDALEVAHQTGIVHRDVNPSNVLIGADERPKLADFGIAHLDDAEASTVTGDVRGTPAFMSPEQIDRALGPIDARSDVYGLGATLFMLLTFARPFEGSSPLEVMQRVLQDGPRDPRELRADVPEELAAICLKAMSRAREQRYATAAELSDDLRRWLRHEGVLARPPGVLSRGKKWCRRHPVVALAMAAGLLLLTVVSWFAYRLAQEADRALEMAAEAKAEAEARREALELALRLVERFAPSDGADAKQTARGALDEVARRLKSGFEKHGGVQARVAQSAAKVAERWAFHSQAEELLCFALEQYESSLGDTSVEALGARTSLAAVRRVRGQNDEAHCQLAAVLDELQSSRIDDPVVLCAARTNLAGERLARGDFHSAERLLRVALDEQGDALGMHSDSILRAHYLYAATLTISGDPWRGQRELGHVLQRIEEAGRGAGDLANTARSALGAAYNAIGEYDCAERLLTQAHTQIVLQLGRDHPVALSTAVNLADALSGLDRHGEALLLFHSVLAARQRTLRPDDPALLSMHSSIGLSSVRLGRFAEAEPHLRKVVEHPGEIQLTGADVKSNARCNLALLLVETRRFVEAAHLIRGEYERRTSLRGRQDRDRLFAMEVFVRALWGQRNLEEASHLAPLLVANTPALARERPFREALLREIEADVARPIEASAPRER